MILPINLRAWRGSIISDTINLFGVTPDKSAYICYPVMNQREPASDCPAFASLDPTQAQQLMDDLWACGVRPSEGTGSAGSLAATQSHLSDLRTILFHQLEIPNVK